MAKRKSMEGPVPSKKRPLRRSEIPLVVVKAQPDGGFVATSPWFPEMVTAGDDLRETVQNVREALGAVTVTMPGKKTLRGPSEIPLVVVKPQADGGFVATSPWFPEMVTEGDDLREMVENVREALGAVIDMYDKLDQPLPTRPTRRWR